MYCRDLCGNKLVTITGEGYISAFEDMPKLEVLWVLHEICYIIVVITVLW